VGEPWSYYLERDKDTGLILVDPADEEVAVLQSLRAWLLENRIGAISGWQESARDVYIDPSHAQRCASVNHGLV